MRRACDISREISYNKRYQEATKSIDLDEFVDFYNSHNDDECKEHYHLTSTMLKRFLKENGIKKTIERFKILSYRTRLEKYGNGTYRNADKAKQTKLERYGIETYNNSDKISQTRRNFTKEQNEKINEKRKATCLEVYGYEASSQSPEVKQKEIQTCMEKYGVPYFCMTNKCRKTGFNNSSFNKNFANILNDNAISFEEEIWIGKFSYDFFLPEFNIYIEVDPFVYHNSSWSPFGDTKSELYHKEKTMRALEQGSICIHVFDWTNIDEILYRIKSGYYSKVVAKIGEPTKFIYDTKEKKLVREENENTVIIFDDGVDYELRTDIK